MCRMKRNNSFLHRHRGYVRLSLILDNNFPLDVQDLHDQVDQVEPEH
jgi:hypothetical protein